METYNRSQKQQNLGGVPGRTRTSDLQIRKPWTAWLALARFLSNFNILGKAGIRGECPQLTNSYTSALVVLSALSCAADSRTQKVARTVSILLVLAGTARLPRLTREIKRHTTEIKPPFDLDAEQEPC